MAENDIPKLTALTQDMTPQPETETAPAVDFELPEVPAEVTEKLAEFREEGMTNSMNFGTAAPVPYRDHTLGDTYLGVIAFGTLDYYLPEDAAGDVAAYPLTRILSSCTTTSRRRLNSATRMHSRA